MASEREFMVRRCEIGRAWWHMTIILALERLRQEDLGEFENSLCYIASSRPALRERRRLSQEKERKNKM